MANYGLLITVDGSGTWNRGSVTRGATALSGGTSTSTLPTADTTAKNSLHEALPIALRAFKNWVAANGNPATNLAALLTDNGNGTYTVSSVKYDISSVTSGSAVSLPSETVTSGLNLHTAFSRMARAVKNDKAANG